MGYPGGRGWTAWLLGGVHHALDVVVLLVGFLLAFFLTVLLSPLVAAPFNGRLSEAVEQRASGAASVDASWRQELLWIARSVGLELLKLLMYLGVVIPLWLVSLLLPWLSPVTSVLAFVFTALHAAVDYTDSPQERRGRGVFQTYGFALDHLRPMFGFGAGAIAFLFVPLLNLLFLPALVAGGTLLYLDLVEARANDVSSAGFPPTV